MTVEQALTALKELEGLVRVGVTISADDLAAIHFALEEARRWAVPNTLR